MTTKTTPQDKSAYTGGVPDNSRTIGPLATKLEAIGKYSIFYSLVLVLFYIGGMKFTAYEAEGISGLIANSPVLAWTYGIFSTQGLSNLIGIIELVIAAMIAARPVYAWVSAIGGALAAGLFVVTLSFLLSTPGVVESSLGFPALTVMPGQFLLKDIVMLGAAVFVTGNSLRELVDTGK
jgi:uncharacterized membrane protein YkgB